MDGEASRKKLGGSRRQVRGLAGAVISETLDLGIRWLKWYTLLLEEQVAVDI